MTWLIIGFLILDYFVTYFLIYKILKNVAIKINNQIENEMNNRFAAIQKLVSKMENPNEYEVTFVGEVIRLRTLAQKYRKEQKLKDAMNYENKITQILNNFNVLIKEFEQFNNINPEIVNDINKEITENNIKIVELIKKYNEQIGKINKIKNFIIFVPITKLHKTKEVLF